MGKRITKLLISSFIAFGVMLFSNMPKNDVIKVNADELVGTPTVGWNNVDYSKDLNWVPFTNESNIPQQGYCLLPLYPSNIASNTYYSENLITSNMEGCNVGDHILINGIESRNVAGAVIYCYPQDGFFLYVPHSSVNFSEEYEYVTVEVLEGMSIDGTAQTVATRFEYRGLLGSYDHWEVNPEPVEKIKGEFERIDWNNVDYSYTVHGEWGGELTPSGAPRDGYCLLAFFKEEGKTYDESTIGDVTMTGRGVIGQGLNVDYKVKVNGVNIIDVAGSVCYIYPKFGLFFYIPEASITYNETYIYPVISMESGVHFNNVFLPAITFEFRGEIGQTGCWTYLKDASEYNKYPFTGVAVDWNNVPADATHNQNVLQFGENTPDHIDYLRNNHTSDESNLVNKYSDCGTKITVNGVPLAEIEESVVSYIHGFGYVYIALPVSVLSPSNGYKIVTLHIEENTVFFDTLLTEVNLYLFNGKWVLTRPETPLDGDYDNALSFQDTFGNEKVTLNDESKQITSIKECSINSLSLLMDYKLISEDSAFVLYVAGSSNLKGLRLVFRSNLITLYDATKGNALLGSAELGVFSYDEWYSLFIYTKLDGNSLSVCVAIDDIIYIHVDNVVFEDESSIGGTFSLNLGNGSASFKNATLGADNKKPVITYTGKAVYSVLSNSDIIDFTNKCSAYDIVDGNVTKLIDYVWPEGALNGDKVNKGVWEVRIIASDKSNNTAEIVVIVIAADKLDVVVTFDGQNPTNYRVGDHIASIAEPTKEGYRFLGWYYNDVLWDFENDYVICDINLVSKYLETTTEHCVSFNVEGLEGVSTYILYFKHGTTLDLNMFARDGYTMKAYVEDNEVESITVNENMVVRLVYTSTNPSSGASGGCGGNITMTASVLSILSGVSFILLVIAKKKGGKEHE